MKKFNTNRLVALLACLCLITSCFVGTTLAKYVTTAGGSDSARVAKWGVTITTTGEMFANSYKNTKATFTENENTNDITVQTKTSTEGNIIAPGTNGTLAAYEIAGAPEVDVNVTYVATLDLGENWMVDITDDQTDNAVFYCPIEFTIGTVNDDSDATVISGLDYDNAADLEADVKDAIEAAAAYYHTNTDLSAVEDDFSVAWAWAYSVDATNDAKDTALGDAAAAGNAATIELETSVTITQAD